MTLQEGDFIIGRISKIESLGAVDGPGIRTIFFMQGCSLNCAYCHNPETWDFNGGISLTENDIVNKVKRLKPYYKNTGGVTFSGGEPLFQLDFLLATMKELKKASINIALDTSGFLLNEKVFELLEMVDYVLLDLKFSNDEQYVKYTDIDFKMVIKFLDYLNKVKKNTLIRHVVLPGINDDEAHLKQLASIVNEYTCIKRIDMLPFKKLCMEKYESLKIPFPMADIDECDNENLQRVQSIFES